MRHLLNLICFLATLIATAVLASAFRASAEPQAFALGCAAIFLSLLAPESALVALLVALPVFGNKPATAHCWYLTVLVSGIILGATARQIFQRTTVEADRPTLVFVSLLYLFCSILSLSALPLDRAVADLTQAIAGTVGVRQAVSTFAFWIAGLFRLAEDQSLYPIVAVLKSILAFQIGMILYDTITLRLKRDEQSGERLAVTYCSAVLAGSATAIICGLIQYYHPIGLELLRPLDPTANAGGVEFRLQSFFAHSGWFAEYLTLTIPFVISLLLLPLRFSFRVGFVLALLLLGEFALILSYQRGGWISYPLTLVAVWAAIYAFRVDEKNGAGISFGSIVRSSLGKILLSVPLTVLLSLSVIWLVQHRGSQTNPAVDTYVERFKDISKTSDRTQFMRAGFYLTSLHPFFGAGSESFAIEFDREFDSVDGAYFQKIDLPLHGSAHNVFFQTAAGKGFGGLILLLITVLSLGRCGLRSLSQVGLSRRRVAVGLIGGCFAAAFLIYGNVQEIFYVYPLEILFFSVIGISAAAGPLEGNPNKAGPAGAVQANKGFRRILCLAMVVFFAGHIVWEYLVPGRTAKRLATEPYGCFAFEIGQDHRRYRWCGPVVRQYAPIIIENNIRGAHLDLRIPLSVQAENRVRIKINGQVMAEKILSVGVEESIHVPLPASVPVEDLAVPVEIESTALVIPSRDLPGARDYRLLSFQIVG